MRTLIEYTTAVDDIVKWSAFHHRHSPTTRRVLAVSLTFCVAACVFVIWVVARYRPSSGWILVLAIVVPTLLFWPGYWRLHDVIVKRALTEGQTHGFVGWHRLSLDENCLREECDAGVSMTRLAALDRIVELDDMVVIYLSATTAYVIPRSSVSQGNLGLFVKKLRLQVAAAKGPVTGLASDTSR